jgi:hypothetical protein
VSVCAKERERERESARARDTAREREREIEKERVLSLFFCRFFQNSSIKRRNMQGRSLRGSLWRMYICVWERERQDIFYIQKSKTTQ